MFEEVFDALTIPHWESDHVNFHALMEITHRLKQKTSKNRVSKHCHLWNTRTGFAQPNEISEERERFVHLLEHEINKLNYGYNYHLREIKLKHLLLTSQLHKLVLIL
jgi:hypothetical protein